MTGGGAKSVTAATGAAEEVAAQLALLAQFHLDNILISSRKDELWHVMCSSEESFIFQRCRVTPSLWPQFEFFIRQCNATPACNWESTRRARMIAAQMSGSKMLSMRVCVCTCEPDGDSREELVEDGGWGVRGFCACESAALDVQ